LVAAGGVFRLAADGMLLDRPTHMMSSGGPLLAGEAGREAILPLKRDASGNLGVQASGGGGTQIVMNTPITIVAGPNGNVNTPDRAAQAAIQRSIEASARAAVLAVLTDEMRTGGMLHVTGGHF
jgi:phage-related minor tail protein